MIIVVYVFFALVTFSIILYMMERADSSGTNIDFLVINAVGAFGFSFFWPVTWMFVILFYGFAKPLSKLANR